MGESIGAGILAAVPPQASSNHRCVCARPGGTTRNYSAGVDEDDGFARAPRRWRLVVGAVVSAAVVGVAVTVGAGVVRTAAVPAATPLPVATASASAVYVDVSGAVRSPGLYALEPGARTVDAIAAAGGFTDDAERTGVNLARPVVDGEQLLVAVAGESHDPAAAGPVSDGVIDLNTASVDELDTLPRVGPAIAARIVAWREENGRFAAVEDLLNVSGIGEKMLAGLRDLVRV